MYVHIYISIFVCVYNVVESCVLLSKSVLLLWSKKILLHKVFSMDKVFQQDCFSMAYNLSEYLIGLFSLQGGFHQLWLALGVLGDVLVCVKT